MKNTFLEKSYGKCDGETILCLFSIILKLHISLDQVSCIYIVPSLGLSKYTETKL